MAAVVNIADERVLTDLVKGDESQKVRLAALAKIRSNSFLAEVLADALCRATLDERREVWRTALAQANDPGLLAYVARTGCAEWVGAEIVACLTDEVLLAGIAREGKDRNVTRAALRKVGSEQNLLAVVLDSRVDRTMRNLAIGKLGAEAVASLVRTAPDARVRSQAVEEVKDESLLEQIAGQDRDRDVRRKAISKIQDQHALTRLARSIDDPELRRAAVSRISAPDCLAELRDILDGVQTALDSLGASGKFPGDWCRDDDGKRLLTITESPNTNGTGCQYYESGACLFRVRVRHDMSFGPEACSVPAGGYRQCFVLAS